MPANFLAPTTSIDPVLDVRLVTRRSMVCCLAAIVLAQVTARADTPAAPVPLAAVRLTTAPVIDGVLDDEAWTGAPMAIDVS